MLQATYFFLGGGQWGQKASTIDKEVENQILPQIFGYAWTYHQLGHWRVCLWPFMAASWLKKYPNDAVDIAVAEGGAMVGEMCV